MFTTELWLTPLILLPGVGLLIISTANRFSQIQIEFHRLLDHPDHAEKAVTRGLKERCVYFQRALAGLYTSVALFSLGSLLGGVINLWRPNSLWVVGGLTIVGIGCIVYAALQLVKENSFSLQIIEQQFSYIELNERRK